jgi:hypothetical protein
VLEALPDRGDESQQALLVPADGAGRERDEVGRRRARLADRLALAGLQEHVERALAVVVRSLIDLVASAEAHRLLPVKEKTSSPWYL